MAKQHQQNTRTKTGLVGRLPRNGWAYTGLANALRKQGKNTAALLNEKLAKKAFERSDVKVVEAVY